MRIVIITIFLVLFGGVSAVYSSDVQTMSTDELKEMLGSQDLVILDVRAGRDWSSSEFKIMGAVREAPGEVSAWIDRYEKDKTVVLYCA